MSIRVVAAALFAAFLPLAAQANDEDEGRFYALAGFGTVRVDLGDLEAYYEALAAGYSATGATRSDASTDDGGRAFGFGFGYWLHPSLALEGYFRDFGRPVTGVSATFASGSSNSESTEYHASGFGVALLGLMPVAEWLSLFGRVDLVDMRTAYETASYASSSGAYTDAGEDRGMEAGFGLGAQYDFRHGVSVRMDWQRMEMPLRQRGLGSDTTFDSVNLFLMKSL